MARGRFVSKAISLDEKVDALSDDTARLLFTWLITHLDCEGRMHGDAQTVKSIVFPRRRNISIQKIEKYLKELEKSELISRYSVDGNEYLWMENFEKHQPGLQKSKEAQSQIPPFTPELLQSYSRVTPPQVKVKVKIKEEDKDNTPLNPPTVSLSQPSIEEVIEIYEQNICLEGTTIREETENELKLAVQQFSAQWVIDAIKESKAQNHPTWPYIAGILNNWRKYGKDADKTSKGRGGPNKFIRGKYGHRVQR